MTTPMPNDQYGRSVTLEIENGKDVYTVIGENDQLFTVSYPAGTPEKKVYRAINSMAPTPPPELTEEEQS